MPTKKRKKQPMVRTRRFANVLDGRRTRTTTTVVSSPPPPGPSLAHCCPARAALAHLRCSRGVFLGHGFSYQIHKITTELLPEPLESRWAGYCMRRGGPTDEGARRLPLPVLSLLSPLPPPSSLSSLPWHLSSLPSLSSPFSVPWFRLFWHIARIAVVSPLSNDKHTTKTRGFLARC